MNTTQELEHFDEAQWLRYFQTMEQQQITLRTLYLVLMAVIFVAGVGGNVLTCVVIYCDRSMHTVTNYYLFNLAVSDLVVLIAMLVEVYVFNGKFWINMFDSVGDAICKVHFFMVGTLWNNGILIMTVVAVERYAAIVRPLMVAAGGARQRVARVMALVWSAAVLESLPDAFTTRLIRVRGESALCFITPTLYARVVNATAALGTFVLPLAVMLYVHVAIAITVNARQKTTYEDNIFNHRNNRKKVNKLIVALTLSFLVCWLPYFSLRVTVAVGEPHSLLSIAQHWELWYEAVCLSSWFSSVLNPLLFSLMSTKFRKALKKLWHTKLLRRNVERIPVLI